MSLFKPVAKDITLCINVTDLDLTGVIQTLTGVWSGSILPKYIFLNFNQEKIGVSNYHLERTIDLFKINDVVVSMAFSPKNCVREARQTCIDAVRTEWAWLLDDDTVPYSDPIENFRYVLADIELQGPLPPVFIFGTHVYATNPGNIPGLTLAEKDFKTTHPAWHLWNYAESDTPNIPRYRGSYIVDTGNIFINKTLFVESGFKFFDPRIHKYNKTSGEDTLFGLYMLEHNYFGCFSPDIQSVHLLKPGSKQNFSYDDAIVSYISSEIASYSDITKNYYRRFLSGKYK
jgi:hypothetical protein